MITTQTSCIANIFSFSRRAYFEHSAHSTFPGGRDQSFSGRSTTNAPSSFQRSNELLLWCQRQVVKARGAGDGQEEGGGSGREGGRGAMAKSSEFEAI